MWPRMAGWHDLNRLRRDMDYLLGGTSGPIQTAYPAFNVWTGDEGMIVSAEVPGYDPDQIKITVDGDILTVSGTRDEESIPEGVSYHRRERRLNDFTRTVQLPYHVDAEGVEATFQNGVLTIELPRIPEEKPKRIEIKSA